MAKILLISIMLCILTGCTRVEIIGLVAPPNVEYSVAEASIIVVGKVVDILPTRWSTPDGTLLVYPDPDAEPTPYTIFQPVMFEPEEFIRGEELVGEEARTGDLLYFARFGGQIGMVTMGDSSDYLTFKWNQRVVLFLKPWEHLERLGDLAAEDLPRWVVITRYIIEDDQVQVLDTQVPLQEFLENVRELESQDRSK
jgi:hypothetical protein